jgi:hypothetical protein
VPVLCGIAHSGFPFESSSQLASRADFWLIMAVIPLKKGGGPIFVPTNPHGSLLEPVSPYGTGTAVQVPGGITARTHGKRSAMEYGLLRG